MKRFAIVLALLLPLFGYAATSQLWTPVAAAKRAPDAARSGAVAVRVEADALFAMRPGEEIGIALPNGRQIFGTFEHKVVHGPEITTWVGYVSGIGADARIYVTRGPGGSYGWIYHPDGEWAIIPGEGHDWLLDITAEQAHRPLPRFVQDGLAPPAHLLIEPPGGRAKVDPVCPEVVTRPSPQSTIDIMFAYTPSWTAAIGAANIQTRLAALIAQINQIYVDSNIAITLRLVHSFPVDYPAPNGDDSEALDAITNGTGVFAGVAALRNQFGADMVGLLRGPGAGGGISGVAWVGGFNQSDIAGSVNVMYSVSGDAPGFSGRLIAHELGHNMGNFHDKGNAGSGLPATSYSFGHVVCGVGAVTNCGSPALAGFYDTGTGFGTVMAYPRPSVSKFSSPNLTCTSPTANGVTAPCGVAGVADNVRSMNCMRQKIAAMKSAGTVVPTQLQFRSALATVSSPNTSIALPVSRTGELGSAVTVQFATANGTGLAGTHYSATSGTLSWGAGDGADKQIVVPILINAPDTDRTFTITLSGVAGPTGVALGSPAQVTVTIRSPGVFPPNGQLPTGWTTPAGAQQGWLVATDATFEGAFSLKSQPIGHSQKAQISVSGNFQAGNLTFARKVSAEAGSACGGFCDGLRVLIDNVVALSVAGESDWQTATLPIAAGQRTIVFSYEKDGSVVSGSDAAWIDAVVLPPLGGPQVLTVSRSGSGSGTISSSPAGISCGATCSASFALNTAVTLTAAAAAGSTFTGWSGDCSGFATCQVSMGAPRNVAASFTLGTTACDLTNAALDCDADGIPNGVEQSVGGNALVKDNDLFTNTELGRRLFVMQQFRDFLGREADSGGLGFWLGELNAGRQNRASMAESFLNSAEYQNQVAPIIRLFFATYLRIPDTEGLAFWTAQFRAGMPLTTIAQNFALAPEFVQRYGNLSNRDYVDRLYQNILERPADTAGSNFWTAQLDSGASSRGAMLVNFSESTEHLARSASKVYVTAMYVAFLRRAPDQGGFDFWRGQLGSGVSGLNLVNSFLGAPEYRSRFLP